MKRSLLPAVCYIVPVDAHTPFPQYQQEIGNYYPDPDPDPEPEPPVSLASLSFSEAAAAYSAR